MRALRDGRGNSDTTGTDSRRNRAPFSRWLLVLLVPLWTGCASLGRPSNAGQAPARRLVLALDGIDYRDIVDARARGLFAQFREPSRLISTFPSISDIAWHDILEVQPPKGYQRIYYSNAFNDVVGGALDAIRPIEFEDRMDMAFGAKFHHLGAYLISNTVAKREVDVTVRDFFDYRGQRTVYVYNVGPDALQHTRGDLPKYLEHLDRRLNQLQARYRQETGQPLEIVVLSDHGHNRGVNASFLPVVKHLAAWGFHAGTTIRSTSDVAFSVDGVTTGFGVFASEPVIDSLARALLELEGVDLVTTRENDSVFIVRRDSLSARIERRTGEGEDRYRYVALVGDPLAYGTLTERMRAEGAADTAGFAESAAWVRYTAMSVYPAAVVRIARGHTSVTLNPAPILVSVKDGFRVGLGMVSIANRMRPLGGTHGALNASNSLGVLMTTFVDTRDDLTSTVRRQFDNFADFGPIHYHTSGARLTSDALIANDRRHPFFPMAMADSSGAQLLLDLWITPAQREWMGESGALFIEMREVRGAARVDSVIGTSYLAIVPPSGDAPLPVTVPTVSPNGDWHSSADGLHYLVGVAPLAGGPLRPSAEYSFRVVMTRGRTSGSGGDGKTRLLASLVVRTNDRGELWPY